MKAPLAACAVIAALLTGCDADPQLIGEWETVQEGQRMTVVFAADSTFTMDTGQFQGEGRYLQTDMELRLEPSGALATAVPGGFTGELADWTTLSLCSPSGLCTDFTKVE